MDHKTSHTFPLLEAQKAFDFNDSRDPSIRKIVLKVPMAACLPEGMWDWK